MNVTILTVETKTNKDNEIEFIARVIGDFYVFGKRKPTTSDVKLNSVEEYEFCSKNLGKEIDMDIIPPASGFALSLEKIITPSVKKN